jgi:hypothetical protein
MKKQSLNSIINEKKKEMRNIIIDKINTEHTSKQITSSQHFDLIQYVQNGMQPKDIKLEAMILHILDKTML